MELADGARDRRLAILERRLDRRAAAGMQDRLGGQGPVGRRAGADLLGDQGDDALRVVDVGVAARAGSTPAPRTAPVRARPSRHHSRELSPTRP